MSLSLPQTNPITVEEIESATILAGGITIELRIKTDSNYIPLHIPVSELKKLLVKLEPVLVEAARIRHTPRNQPQVLFPKDWRVDADPRTGRISLTYLQPGETEITLVFLLSDGCNLRDALTAQIDLAIPTPREESQ